jgi:transcriptional regulator with XRE-family HTH domain
MSTGVVEEDSVSVNKHWERGQAIKRRRLAAGITSLRDFNEATGVSRNAITAAEDGHGSKATYERLEAWLDRFDEETGTDAPDAEGETVTFTIEGDFGVKVTVKGPIRDRQELEASVSNIIRSIRESSPPPARP